MPSGGLCDGGGGAGGVLPSCLLDFLPQASMSEQIQSLLEVFGGPGWKGGSLTEERGVGNINQFSSGL